MSVAVTAPPGGGADMGGKRRSWKQEGLCESRPVRVCALPPLRLPAPVILTPLSLSIHRRDPLLPARRPTASPLTMSSDVERLTDNTFFQLLNRRYAVHWKQAAERGLYVMVPQSCSLSSRSLVENDICASQCPSSSHSPFLPCPYACPCCWKCDSVRLAWSPAVLCPRSPTPLHISRVLLYPACVVPSFVCSLLCLGRPGCIPLQFLPCAPFPVYVHVCACVPIACPLQ